MGEGFMPLPLLKASAFSDIDVAVTRWLRLAFLSPTLVRQIRAGAHPTSLTIESLTRQVDLPTDWQEQEALVAALD